MRTNIARIVPLLATCHREVARYLAGPANMFWVFHVLRDYARTLQATRGGCDGELSRYVALADALEAQRCRCPSCSAITTYSPGNFIDDGRRLWLIDWEYGGFGTAMFDLANLAANASFSPADDQLLLEAYFRQPVSDEVRRSFDAMTSRARLHLGHGCERANGWLLLSLPSGLRQRPLDDPSFTPKTWVTGMRSRAV